MNLRTKVLSALGGILVAGSLFAADTVRRETVVWDFMNSIKIAGVALPGVTSIGMIVTMPAVQVIAATNTITADACGGVKRISSVGAVSTNTTNTFTAPAAANAGCVMRVCNVDDTDAITLDNNALFKSIGGADVVLTAFDCTQVFSDGTLWYSTGSLVAN